ncbi:MAG: GntR family transcriptional regulator [Solirubrobacteraceae bacterium]
MPDRQPAGLDRLDNAPLAERARAAILEAILDKRFVKRLPPEDVLAEMLNVSRTTIRSALQSLEEHGVVSRKRAVGTTINGHIRPSALGLQRLVGFDVLLSEKGYAVRTEVDWERATPPADAVEVFPVAADRDCLVTSKRYFAGKRVAIGVRDVVPWSTLTTESFEEPLAASLFEFSRVYCETPIDHAVVEIIAMVRDAEQGRGLSVEPGRPFTRLNETHYSVDGDPVAFSVIDVDSEFVSFEVFRRE